MENATVEEKEVKNNHNQMLEEGQNENEVDSFHYNNSYARNGLGDNVSDYIS